ncbi:MAG: thioesterase family protein [Bowdeniella nasicola]|nr:thioesterase family protein [Bowdeniella nasicola]
MSAIEVPVRVRWADIDAYGHVNNAAMFTLLEEVRISIFWRSVGFDNSSGAFGLDGTSATFIARQEIEYLKPVGLPHEELPIKVWVSRIGNASIELDYAVPAADGSVAVKARTVIVIVDLTTEKPRRLTEREREDLTALMDEPTEFRRR